MTTRAESERWLAEAIPDFQQTLDDNEADRPLQVAAAKEWQPLHQLLVDSGIAELISAKTATEFPVIEIVPRSYQYDPPASGWPKVEEVNLFTANTESNMERAFPYGAGWTLSIAFWAQADGQLGSTLRIEARHVPDIRVKGNEYTGRPEIVHFEVDQNKNLRVIGIQETFNGPIDHLNKRGLQRVNAGINRAFRRPEIGEKPVGLVALGAA